MSSTLKAEINEKLKEIPLEDLPVTNNGICLIIAAFIELFKIELLE